MTDTTAHVVKPLMPYRILRDSALTPCAINYRTREARDKGAQRWADRDGKAVITELWDAEHPQDAVNRGWAMDGVVKPQQATVDLHIENIYELYDTVVTTPTVTIPLPPDDQGSDEYDEWAYDHIFAETGTGHTEGDSAYFVRITASTVPELVGREFEFGL
jgi:hypothetical protein